LLRVFWQCRKFTVNLAFDGIFNLYIGIDNIDVYRDIGVEYENR